jgi:hypothetical protein
VLEAAAGQQFYNVSKLDLPKLLDDPGQIAGNFMGYIHGLSPGAREMLDRFDFAAQIERLDRSKLLYRVVARFCEIDLHPEYVSNLEMGYLYEELIRRFSELSNETAGEHFTPREVIRLMVNLLFIEDDDLLSKPGVVKTIYDPACGTGGMLSIAEEHLCALNSGARLEVFGQELNAETYAIARSARLAAERRLTFGRTRHCDHSAASASVRACGRYASSLGFLVVRESVWRFRPGRKSRRQGHSEDQKKVLSRVGTQRDSPRLLMYPRTFASATCRSATRVAVPHIS